MPSVPLIAAVLAGYFLALSPHACRYIKHHPDERHYTDAAVQMLRSGDYWTPKTPTGDVRLKKPILTYWLVVSSYQLFGISPLSSRLPFLMVGTGVVWLSYRLAWYIFANRQAGYLAALLVVCQPALLISSPRSVPDVLLTFFQLVSVYGFVRLLRETQVDWMAVAYAYGGSALAVMTKGLPAVVFACYAVALLTWLRVEQFQHGWGKHFIGGLIASAIGVGWFALMAHAHGGILFTQFFGDQVVQRVNTDVFSAARDVPSVLALTAICFLPCSQPLWEACCQWRATRDGRLLPKDPACLLLATWILVYLLSASCVDRVNVRYQCPVVPLVSVLAAGLLIRLGSDRLRSWLTTVGYCTATVLLSLSLVGIAVCLLWAERIAVGCVCGLLGCGWAIGFLYLSSRMAWQYIGLGAVLTLLMVSPIASALLHSVSGPSTDERLWSEIQSTEASHAPIAFITKPSYASRLRVVSGAKVTPYWIGHEATGDALSMNHDTLVLCEQAAAELDLSGFDVTRLENGLHDVSATELAKAVLAGEVTSYLQRHQRYVILAVRPQPRHRPLQVEIASARATFR